MDNGGGLRFGEYETVRRLATGGMAELFLARSGGIDGFTKNLALKRVLPKLATNAFFVDMFLDEARLAATLTHPNIAQIFDLGIANGLPYYTMEYIHGLDALSIMRKLGDTNQRMPLAEALTIIVAAASGLHHAHERQNRGRPLGIVHRDVSPSNILVSYQGDVKVIDFGVAKANEQHNQTRIGMLKGKCAYMSPEQCRGGALDRRSDVFSLGIVLFELTTSTRLFRGASDLDTLNRILTGPVPRPTERRRDYPPMLESIVLKALARSPSDRYATAEALMQALLAFARMNEIELSPLKLSTLVKRLSPSESVSDEPPTRAITRRTAPPVKPEPSVIIEDDLLSVVAIPAPTERPAEPIANAQPRVLLPAARATRNSLTRWACAAAAGALALVAVAFAASPRRQLPSSPTKTPPAAAPMQQNIARATNKTPSWIFEPTERQSARRQHRRARTR